MSIIARKIASSPMRTSIETGKAIANMISANNDVAGNEFKKVLDLIASIINSEVVCQQPIVIVGSGPRLKIYTVFGDEAFDDSCVNERPLGWKLFSEEWVVHVPCLEDEIGFMSRAFNTKSKKFKIYDSKIGMEEKSLNKSDASEITDLGGLRGI